MAEYRPVCNWCIKDKALTPEDERRYLSLNTGYAPCTECMEIFENTVQFIELTEDNKDGRPKIDEADDGTPLYPTLRYIALDAKRANEIMRSIERAYGMPPGETLEDGDAVCVGEDLFRIYFGDMLEEKQ